MESSWMDRFFEASSALGIDAEARELVLSQLLQNCLNSDGWHERPDDTDLFQFLAKCWEYPTMQDSIHAAMGEARFTAERRKNFIQCIQTEQVLLPDRDKELSNHHAAIAPIGTGELQRNRNGDIKENLYNYWTTLESDPSWKGRLEYDLFANRPTLDRKFITDVCEAEIGFWFGQNHRIGGNQSKARRDAILGVSRKKPYDPLREFVEALPPWDKIERLEGLFPTWCGSEMSPYTAWCGVVMVVQMIARALMPGCQARYVVILEGVENTGKSEFVRILGAPWSTVFDTSMDSKEAHMAIQGSWLAELAELDSLNRSQETRIKSFITQTQDFFVPKYSNSPVALPRRTVFVGTTNDTQYLIGQSGNTRFLPVQTGAFKLSLINENRDQILAEALAYHHEHLTDWWEPWDGARAGIALAREQRRVRSIYEEELQSWLDGDAMPTGQPSSYRTEVTMEEIRKEFLRQEIDRLTRVQVLDIAAALRAVGFTRTHRRGGKVWVRADSIPGQGPHRAMFP